MAGTAVSSNFIIDKAGGVTSFHISWGAYAKVIEMTKSGYTVSIIYGTTRGANTLVGNVVTLYGIPEFAPARTYYVDFYNSYTPQKTPGYTGPRYVGGEMTTVNKLGVLAPYLGLIVFLETLAVVMTKRKKKANC